MIFLGKNREISTRTNKTLHNIHLGLVDELRFAEAEAQD